MIVSKVTYNLWSSMLNYAWYYFYTTNVLGDMPIDGLSSSSV